MPALITAVSRAGFCDAHQLVWFNPLQFPPKGSILVSTVLPAHTSKC